MTEDPLVGLRVLVVEDDSMVRHVMIRTASALGVETEAVQDGKTGIAKLNAQSFDIVVTDLKMPGLSGLELLEQIKSLHPKLAVVVVTGFAEDDEEDAVRAAGALLLRKPFNPTQFKAALTWAAQQVGARV